MSRRPDGYMSWQAMISRCEYANDRDYHNYGGRGVRACVRWRRSFVAFMEDMGQRPSPKHSVDRIDGNGDYTPDNCRWATQKEQQNNRRNNRLLTFRGRTMTMSQWADEIGVTICALHQRLARGKMTIEEALTYRPPVIEYGGKVLTATQWAEVLPIKASTIVKRLRDGWSVEDALTRPVRDWGR